MSSFLVLFLFFPEATWRLFGTKRREDRFNSFSSSTISVVFSVSPRGSLLCFYVKYINVKNATNQVIICLFEYLDIGLLCVHVLAKLFWFVPDFLQKHLWECCRAGGGRTNPCRRYAQALSRHAFANSFSSCAGPSWAKAGKYQTALRCIRASWW